MELLMSLMIMAVERAITLFFPHRPTFNRSRTIAIVATLWALSFCFAIPILTPSIPVKPFKFRYLCAVDSNGPILFPLARILVYGGCLFISLVCFGALLSRGNQDKAKSLPVKPEEYSDFIKKSRALQDYLTLAKLVLFLTIAFILIEGPNIILNFFVEVTVYTTYDTINRI
uniref:G_PROTEIN_RECEP_F1_2 domain-containing protein n=1 Tax=Ascaris lumbricoides TaxID=6252 RepID=A0A0M3HU78_ASCLU